MMCVGLGIEKMLVFGTYTSIMSHLDRDNFYHSICAGFVSGCIASLSSTPCEQLSIDRQNNISIQKLRHLYKGLLPTMGRESVGFAVYFASYDKLSKQYNPEKTISKTALCGAFATLFALIFYYPLDKIKTNIQSNNPVNVIKFSDVYKGVHVGLPRALIFHTTCFVTFETLHGKIQSAKLGYV